MFVDYVQNGRGFGEVGQKLADCRCETGLMRPYFGRDGRRYVTIRDMNNPFVFNNKKDTYHPRFRQYRIEELEARGIYSPVANATSLRKDEWIQLDKAVLTEARQRLRAWADLRASNTHGGFDAMSHPILQWHTMSDPGDAVVSMDGVAEDNADTSLFQLEGLPLPITHAGFTFSKRDLAISRNGGQPLNTLMAEASGRRVAETIEKTVIGSETGMTYGDDTDYSLGSTVFGYTNYTNRNTKADLTAPTGTNSSTVLAEVLEIRNDLYDDHFYGPYMVYHSTGWDEFLDNDHFVYMTSGGAAPHQTLRQRLRQIEGIRDIRRLDFLTTDYTLLMIQMTSGVCRAINGMEITTVQWETKGGLQLQFKVMAIQVPQLQSDYQGRCGIMHASTA